MIKSFVSRSAQQSPMLVRQRRCPTLRLCTDHITRRLTSSCSSEASLTAAWQLVRMVALNLWMAVHWRITTGNCFITRCPSAPWSRSTCSPGDGGTNGVRKWRYCVRPGAICCLSWLISKGHISLRVIAEFHFRPRVCGMVWDGYNKILILLCF